MQQPLVDFVISNPGHHAAMVKPVMVSLVQQGYRCRLLSLCEFRGLDSPTTQFKMEGIDFIRIVPFNFRVPSSGGPQTTKASQKWSRKVARKLSWNVLLQWRMNFILHRRKPDLVVLPNDAAFPYDLIVLMLKSADIPFVLMQEGIRFPLPGSEEGDAYGLGGAAAIAAWGEGSATYFRGRGVPPDTIYITGNPRFDSLLNKDYMVEARRLQKTMDLTDNTLLFLSNPIDDQGFCTTQEKLDLVGRFLHDILSLFDNPDFRLIIKLHPRESVSSFQKVVKENLGEHKRVRENQVTVTVSEPLYPLFRLSKAAIVLASTVGLEALMMGVPLGVLEIPKVGFVYEYVQKGVAEGLTWERPMVDQVCKLLARENCDKQAIRNYLNHSLDTLGEATEKVIDLFSHLIAESYENF